MRKGEDVEFQAVKLINYFFESFNAKKFFSEKLMKLLNDVKLHLSHRDCIRASRTWSSIRFIMRSHNFPPIEPILYLKRELEGLSEVIYLVVFRESQVHNKTG